MRKVVIVCLLILLFPLTGTISQPGYREMSTVAEGAEGQLLREGDTLEIPFQTPPETVNNSPWWNNSGLDQDRNKIHDSLQNLSGFTGIGLSYDHTPNQDDIQNLLALGIVSKDVIESVDVILLGQINVSMVPTLAELEGVVMVERYGSVVFYGDIQTMAVKARNSSTYNESAWQLGVSGQGVNIAMVDTGVDNEHPGLSSKFVAGYDAVCYVHSDPTCWGDITRDDSGEYDPDDGNQHGTACMGMASATGIEADGSQSEFYGSAPNASLVDVRIGTDIGAGPFETYAINQEFYESAMNGLQWIIDNKDTAWSGVDAELYGIDIISLSWGITSHESGGSDGSDMHSRILDDATEAGIVVSVAAGNDGSDNDGFSGMGSSSLSITVGATDDKNTVERTDDSIASYSSRGPRKDNGDGNLVNELKPDVSAPGTNIVQAEGCVTSGSCNNLVPGQDAADNTYTGRGSGTSYATPSVSGIIALMLEANPELTPLTVREILKQTAERKDTVSSADGEGVEDGPWATYPDIDPYWNRHFGWGMVDAREAVEMAIQLNNSGFNDSEIDVTLQNYLLNVTTDSGIITILGHSWSQTDVVQRVEFRVGMGEWKEATYEETLENISSGQPFNWTVVLDLSKIEIGEQIVEIRAIGSNGFSLPVSVEVTGTATGIVLGGGSQFMFIISLALLVAVTGGYALYVSNEDKVPLSKAAYSEGIPKDIPKDEGQVIEAEIID